LNDTLILFEDEGYRLLLPLVHTRPTFELRCGIFTLRERVAAITGNDARAICRPHLATVYGAGRWPLSLLSRSANLTFVNGRALDLGWLPDLLHATGNTIVIGEDTHTPQRQPILLGARLSPALASAVLLYLINQEIGLALKELRRFATVREVKARTLIYPWDLITNNGQQVIDDLVLHQQVHHWPSAAQQPPKGDGLVLNNPEQIFLHPAAKLEGPLAIDARDGPVIIDAAKIEPFSFIQGPTYIGPGSLISSARVRGETSIGPVCRIGGEIEASIIQGYSNKHHDGFLGHSYLGEWVNIGAMTTNSDLKNTYGLIKVNIEGMGQVDSGVLKLGCFLSDHVKLGIGLHLNGGAVIGPGSNIFGVHFAPKNIPPFTWGGEIFREYRIDGMIDVTRKVMGRRKLALSAAQETMLRDVFAMTRGYRSNMQGGQALPADEEAALVRAETQAIRAFDPLEMSG
jgi:UDP-N-acetylglucosamine diphosphorylase / glucose-1-phosphate thymidylyltransferase / UDP-N-acetylgalactosamine diphosphorylase / glucosamine-1-phosphate N-acetyltransferase / galactosamine-1-phosphate N-acetyltransferase